MKTNWSIANPPFVAFPSSTRRKSEEAPICTWPAVHSGRAVLRLSAVNIHFCESSATALISIHWSKQVHRPLTVCFLESSSSSSSSSLLSLSFLSARSSRKIRRLVDSPAPKAANLVTKATFLKEHYMKGISFGLWLMAILTAVMVTQQDYIRKTNYHC